MGYECRGCPQGHLISSYAQVSQGRGFLPTSGFFNHMPWRRNAPGGEFTERRRETVKKGISCL